MPSPPLTRESEIGALLRAIEVERKARYADFQGKRSTFSYFMRQTATKLGRRYPMDPRWSTIRGFFLQYPNVDVVTRIAIVRRVEGMLVPKEEMQVGWSNSVSSVAETVARTNDYGDQSANGEKTANGNKADGKTSLPVASGLIGVQTNNVEQGFLSGKQEQAKSGDITAGKPTTKVPATKLPTRASVSKAQAEVLKSSSSNPAETGVQFVPGVGPKLAAVLTNINIETVEDLLHHYPRRYIDFNNRQNIRSLQLGQEVTIFGTIRSVGAFQSRKGNVSIVSITINDGTGSILITKFVGGKSNRYLIERYKAQYPKGAQVLASGIVERDEYTSRLKLKNAEVEVLGVLSDGGESGEELASSMLEASSSLHAGRIVPIYPLTEGIGLRYLRTIIHRALETYGAKVVDPLPPYIIADHQLIDLRSALKNIHFPENMEVAEQARHRLIFDELFNIQLHLAYKRHNVEIKESAIALTFREGGLVDRFRKILPFTLTGAQERVFKEIVQDLGSSKPMQRLVQGDVGSGKTVVALMSFLVAIEHGFQGAMMAPTEILAEQHYRQFQRLLTPLGLKCALVLGKQGVKERRLIQQDLASGQVHIAVGTHALIQDEVEFHNLGLVIIDEQHRFGVKQRAKLKAKGQSPQLLTMTATPIPRTLALTMHGDLDVSEIDELPPGRKPIDTKLVTPGKKKELFEFVRQEVQKGRQAYIVFPLIDESETLSAKAATAEYEKLREKVFPDLRLGLMHGRLKSHEKDEVMDKFRLGELDILISTTVIEVGVDVPNASVMIIENADRFGLAQLHQLRGRVGRGSDQAYCFLVAEQKSPTTRERLEVMTQTNDGFVVAEKDLEIRGPGEFLGVRQSGLPEMILSDIIRDAAILEEARKAAIDLIKKDPELKENPLLGRRLKASNFDEDYLGSG